jgi:hypothetical protein
MAAGSFAVSTTRLLGHFVPIFERGKKAVWLVEIMEPQWTKSISSESICNFFYFFFVLYAVIALFAGVSLLSLLFVMKTKEMGAILPSILTLAVATTQALFFYLICDRALLATRQAEAGKAQEMRDLQ